MKIRCYMHIIAVIDVMNECTPDNLHKVVFDNMDRFELESSDDYRAFTIALDRYVNEGGLNDGK